MITSNVYHRVFQIKFAESTGTIFAIDVDNKQYLVTARHVLDGWDRISRGRVFFNGEWKELPLKVVGIGDGVADIAVLATTLQISPPLELEPTAAGTVWGQDVYFLGFPYGWHANVDSKINRGFPLPFVKKAIISAIQSEDGVQQFFLDGHNNPGFSGGPVVFRKNGSNQLKVAAVVSGYRYTEEPVFSAGAPVPLAYRYNTGIVVAYSIKVATDIIAANPVGFPLDG